MIMIHQLGCVQTMIVCESVVKLISSVTSQESTATVSHLVSLFESSSVVIVPPPDKETTEATEPPIKQQKQSLDDRSSTSIPHSSFHSFVKLLLSPQQQIPCQVIGARLFPILASITSPSAPPPSSLLPLFQPLLSPY